MLQTEASGAFSLPASASPPLLCFCSLSEPVAAPSIRSPKRQPGSPLLLSLLVLCFSSVLTSSWLWSLKYFLNLFSSLHPWGHLPLQPLVCYCHLTARHFKINEVSQAQHTVSHSVPLFMLFPLPRMPSSLHLANFYFLFKTKIRHSIHSLPHQN